MSISLLQAALLSLAVGTAAAAAAYIAAAVIGKRQMASVTGLQQKKLDKLTTEYKRMSRRYAKEKTKAKNLGGELGETRSKLATAVDRVKTLNDNLKMLRTERENTKIKISAMQNSLTKLHQQTQALQREFEKAGQFYKRELAKSFAIRKDLLDDIEEARAEQKAFEKRIKESSLEHGSEEEMIVAAQLRLGQIDVLERTVNKLEAENKKLADEKKSMKKEHDSLRRQLGELEELRINNQQLVQAVEALEKSREHHERNAEQYRDQVGKSEQLSNTLKMKLADLEKSFESMEKEQQQAIDQVREDVDQAANQDEDSSGIIKMSSYTSKRGA